MIDTIIIIASGLSVGLALGLTGSGGSLFAIPLLLYVVGMDISVATPISLLVVGTTSLLGAISAFRKKLLLLRPTVIFGLTGIVSTPLGFKLGEVTPDQYRISAFSLLAILMSIKMARLSYTSEPTALYQTKPSTKEAQGVCRTSSHGEMRFSMPCALVLSLAGLLVGILSGFFGVGGGFLIVPILMTVIKIKMIHAIGSSLAIIALIGVSGGAVYGLPLLMEHQSAQWFAAGSIIGMLTGRKVAGHLTGPWLQRIFSFMLFCTGITMLYLNWR